MICSLLDPWWAASLVLTRHLKSLFWSSECRTMGAMKKCLKWKDLTTKASNAAAASECLILHAIASRAKPGPTSWNTAMYSKWIRNSFKTVQHWWCYTEIIGSQASKVSKNIFGFLKMMNFKCQARCKKCFNCAAETNQMIPTPVKSGKQSVVK